MATMEDIRFNPQDPNEIYDLIDLLGEGSYGAVYKAVLKAEPERPPVAIKIIPAEEDLSSLKREIAILERCKCAYIVEFKDCFFVDNELWIVMEFCLSGSVSDMLDATEKTLTEAQIRSVCACVALGLSYLHENHNIHRDLKAGNILLSTDGKAKLADFGVSATLNNTISKRKTVIGTPFWMAPEVIQETSYDGKADVWSLGITAIEMAEGMPPHFNVHPMRAIFLIPSKPPPKLTDPAKWSNEFNDFIKCCLVKDPSKRIDSRSLLTHPFIRKDVEALRADASVGLPPIVELVEASLEQLKRYRQGSDAKSGGSDQGDNEATVRPLNTGDVTGISGTINRRGTANARSPRSGSIVQDATVIRHNRRATPDSLAADAAGAPDATLVRTGPRGGRHRRGLSSGEAPSGTMVRHRPASRRDSREDLGVEDNPELSGTTNFTGTSNKMDANPGLQSALRYFQSQATSSSFTDSVSSAATAPAGADERATTVRTGSLAHESEGGGGSSAIDEAPLPPAPSTMPPEPPTPTQGGPASYHDRKLRELKSSTAQEIQEQLKALETQYREDMEALHRAYQARKNELEEALSHC